MAVAMPEPDASVLQRRERIALPARNMDEAPRVELAVIGGAGGDLEDFEELVRARARGDEIARAA